MNADVPAQPTVLRPVSLIRRRLCYGRVRHPLIAQRSRVDGYNGRSRGIR